MWLLETFQRSLNFRFGVDQKIRTRDHPFAFNEAILYLDAIAILRTELDQAWFKSSLASINEDNTVSARWHDRS